MLKAVKTKRQHVKIITFTNIFLERNMGFQKVTQGNENVCDLGYPYIILLNRQWEYTKESKIVWGCEILLWDTENYWTHKKKNVATYFYGKLQIIYFNFLLFYRMSARARLVFLLYFAKKIGPIFFSPFWPSTYHLDVETGNLTTL
jgi:hypothetical protein